MMGLLPDFKYKKELTLALVIGFFIFAPVVPLYRFESSETVKALYVFLAIVIIPPIFMGIVISLVRTILVNIKGEYPDILDKFYVPLIIGYFFVGIVFFAVLILES